MPFNLMKTLGFGSLLVAATIALTGCIIVVDEDDDDDDSWKESRYEEADRADFHTGT